MAATFHTPCIDWFQQVVAGTWWDALTPRLFLLPLQLEAGADSGPLQSAAGSAAARRSATGAP